MEHKKESTWSWILWWKIDKEDVKKQAENYSSLKLTDTSKGIASLLLLGSLVLSLILSFIGWMPTGDTLWSIAIYLPVIFFVFKGNRLAIVVMMIAWTVEKTYSLITRVSTDFQPYQLIIALSWWAIVMNPLYEAFKVEQLRKKGHQENNELRQHNVATNFEDKEHHAIKTRENRKPKVGLFVISALVILSISIPIFYWFQIRPVDIKHECSWVTTHFDEVPAKQGKTEEEVFAESNMSREEFDRSLKLARYEIEPYNPTPGRILPLTDQSLDTAGKHNDGWLQFIGQDYLEKMKTIPGKPARDETRQATVQEYSFCLHDKGL